MYKNTLYKNIEAEKAKEIKNIFGYAEAQLVSVENFFLANTDNFTKKRSKILTYPRVLFIYLYLSEKDIV